MKHLYIDAGSIKNNYLYLNDYIVAHSFDIVAICEIWLGSSDYDDTCVNGLLWIPTGYTEQIAGLGSSIVDQVLKYTKYPKYIPSTSTGQVLIFFKVLKYIKYFHIKYKYKYSY